MFNRTQLFITITLAAIGVSMAAVWGLIGTAHAQGIGTSPADPGALLALAGDLYRAVTGGEASGWAIASMSLMLVIGGGRWFARSDKTGKYGDWLESTLYGSDWRGTLSTLVLGALGAMATSILGGYGAPDLALLKTGALVGAAAAGGYSVLWKRLLLPLLAKLVPSLGSAVPE